MVHERYKKIVYEDEAMLDQRRAATNGNVILLVFLGCLEFWMVLAYSLLLALVTDPSAKLGSFETSLKMGVTRARRRDLTQETSFKVRQYGI